MSNALKRLLCEKRFFSTINWTKSLRPQCLSRRRRKGLNRMYPFTEYIAGQITSAFEQLLNRKHLYQHVDLDLSGINPTTATVEVQKIPRAPLNSGAKTSMPSVEEVIELGRNHAKKTWFPQGGLATEAGSQRFGPPPTVTVQGPQHVMFSIPSVQTFCSHCEGSWPFNHIDDIVNIGAREDQWFCLGYQCQKCKKLPVWFFIRRKGLRITLVGRDPIEAIPAPKEVPEPQGKFFAKAIMAYNTGQTLAGIFFLRTFIAQPSN